MNKQKIIALALDVANNVIQADSLKQELIEEGFDKVIAEEFCVAAVASRDFMYKSRRERTARHMVEFYIRENEEQKNSSIEG